MSNSHFTKILVVLAALLVCASMMQAQSPLTYTLTPAGTTVSLTYQKGAPNVQGPNVTALIKASASTPFFVEPTSVPIWLGVDVMSSTADSTGVPLTFSPPPVSALIAAGSYSATVKLDVIGASSLSTLSIPVTLVVSDVAPTLTVTGSLSFSWAQGTPLPTKTLTVTSSNEPVNFTVAEVVTSPTAPANWIQIDHASSVAYSWGTQVVITFNPLLAYSALGSFTGTVSITPVGGSAITKNVVITVTPPTAAITALYPAAIPPQTTAGDSDNWVIALTGSGFISPSATVVKVGPDTLDPSLVTVVNSSTMTIVVGSKKYLKTAGSVTITAANGSDTPSSQTLLVTTNPIIYAVTSSASYQQPGPGGTPNVAPYELISIFGDNFGPTAPTVVPGTPDSFGLFPAALPSSPPSTVVNFYKADGTTSLGSAPLLFVSQQQINAVVPAAVAGTTAAPLTAVKLSVTYNSNESLKQSANVKAADPGVFTTAANGIGQGAILNSDYTANSSAYAAKAGSTVMIYMAGLGAPTSTGANTASATAAAFPKSCISTAAYLAAVNGQSGPPNPLWTKIDGAVIESALLAHNVFPPCFATAPTVSIGGKAATVTYAGWVAGSVGGLYQVNATIPTTVGASNLVPVLVTAGGFTSQAGVTMAVVLSTSVNGH